jgi:hypothetical protein
VYVFFREPKSLGALVPHLSGYAGPFSVVEGHTAFGDLFLRDPRTGEYAVLTSSRLELIETGETNRAGFREQILENPGVIDELLRPADVAVLRARLGEPGEGLVFFPVPLSAIGGSGRLETYDRGGLWEFLDITARILGTALDTGTAEA